MWARTVLILTAGLIWLGVAARAADLVMVDAPGCPYCAAWKREVGPDYPTSRAATFAPLRIVEASQIRKARIRLARRVVYTPTFLLVEDNREVARIEGYPGKAQFWAVLDNVLTRHTAYRPE